MKEIRITGMEPNELRALFLEIGQMIIEETNTLKKAEELPELMTQKQVAKYYQVTVKTVSNWESAGLLNRVILKNTSSFRYRKTDVLNLKK